MTQRHQQPSLFDTNGLNVDRTVKAAMNQAARECSLSREQIADAINKMMERHGISACRGGTVSLNLLEKWLNVSDTSRHIPLRILPIFCAATGSRAPLQALADALGGRVIGGDEARLLDWAKAYRRAKKARREMQKLEALIDD